MRYHHLLYPIVLLTSQFPSAAQTSISDVDGNLRTSRFVAPGEVVRLLFRDFQGTFEFGGRIASKLPIPTSFSGISITLRQSGSAEEIPVPLISTSGTGSNCAGLLPLPSSANVVPCANLTDNFGLVVQIPHRLKANAQGLGNRGNDAINQPCGPLMNPPKNCEFDINDAVLTVRYGTQTTNFRVTPVVDQIHIIDTCQDGWAPRSIVPRLGLNYQSSFCYPAIIHADGSEVSPTSPARAGEVVAIYARGLGAPDRLFDDTMGTPPGGVPVSRPFTITFSGGAAPASSTPEWVGLAAGGAGLYQVNVRIPQLMAEFPPCGSERDFNFTLTLKGTASVDTASFCVSP